MGDRHGHGSRGGRDDRSRDDRRDYRDERRGHESREGPYGGGGHHGPRHHREAIGGHHRDQQTAQDPHRSRPPPGYPGGGSGYGGRGGGRDGGRGRGRGRGGGPGRGFALDVCAPPPQEWRQGLKGDPGKFLDVQPPRTPPPQEQAAPGALLAMARPGHGRAGEPGRVYANHFLLRSRRPTAVHYDVNIEREEYAPKGDAGGSQKALGEPGGGAVPEHRPRPLLREDCREIMRALASTEGVNLPTGWAFDGKKNMFCPGRLDPDTVAKLREGCLVVMDGGRTKYSVTVQEVAVVDLQSLAKSLNVTMDAAVQRALLVLDVVFRHRVSMIPEIHERGNAFFNHERADGSKPPKQTVSLGDSGGIDVVQGYKQTVHLVENGLSVTMDLAFTMFVQPIKLVDFLVDKAEARSPDDLSSMLKRDPQLRRRLVKEIKGLRFEATHLKSRPIKKVKELTEPADEFFFDCKGRNMNVAEYFKENYIKLRYPGLPCVNVGSARKPTCFPLEVCLIIPGQRPVKALKDVQRSLLPRYCTKKPGDYQKTIQYSLEKLADFNNDPVVQAFDLHVETQMMQLPARVLQSPTLEYTVPGSGIRGEPSIKTKDVRNGGWNLRDVRFREPADLLSWGVVVLKTARNVQFDDSAIDRFVDELSRMLRTCGLSVPRDPPKVHDYTGRESMEAVFSNAAAYAEKRYNSPCQLLLVVLSEKTAHVAQEVKRAGDHSLGIVTQRVLGDGTQRNLQLQGKAHKIANDQYLANVALKINAKLGGINAVLSWDSVRDPHPLPGLNMNIPFMILGADVNHPGSGADSTQPSIAALVASMDAWACQYAGRVYRQGHREELFADLKEAVKELVRQWMETTTCPLLPQQIIYYRDGVSQGQFASLLQTEWTALKEAFVELSSEMKLAPTQQPALTFVVMQKRHSTRFFPADRQTDDGKGNVKPGTVVDTGVVMSYGFDFYLNSHQALQGTTRPAHYHVLLDENQFTPDEIQQLTFKQCFLFCRATKSVSQVTPVYYAHLAAKRGCELLKHHASDSASDAGSVGPGPGPTFQPIHNNLRNCMFWA